MKDAKEKTLELLSKTHLMSLATNDENGIWVADVIFIHNNDLDIYWMSSPKTRHSKAILKDNKVAGTITHSTKSKEPNLAIQFEGIAEKLEGTNFKLLIKHLAKRNYDVPKISEAEKILGNSSWYKLKPTKIGLIDEENFGFERQDFYL